MIINRNRNFIDDWIDRLRGHVAKKTMDNAAKYLVTQKHDFIRAVVITSIARTLLGIPKLSHSHVSKLRVKFPELREYLNTSTRHTFYLWEIVKALDDFELELKFAGDVPKTQARKLLNIGQQIGLSKYLFNALPHVLQLPSYEFDIAIVVSEMVVVSYNPDVKAAPLIDSAACVHDWVEESATNDWQSYCMKCEQKAQGSCQG